MIDPSVNVTNQQLKVLRAIDAWWKDKGYAPSTLELRDLMQFASSSAALKHVDALRKKGLLKRDIATARSLVITEDGRSLL